MILVLEILEKIKIHMSDAYTAAHFIGGNMFKNKELHLTDITDKDAINIADYIAEKYYFCNLLPVDVNGAKIAKYLEKYISTTGPILLIGFKYDKEVFNFYRKNLVCDSFIRAIAIYTTEKPVSWVDCIYRRY